MSVLVFIEQRDGKVRASSLEALAEGRRLSDSGLGGDVTAVVPGHDVQGLEKLGEYGADLVLSAEHADFVRYQPEGYAGAVCKAREKTGARVLLAPASALGKDLIPRVSARLDVPMASDCTQLSWSDGSLKIQRPVYAGKANQTLKLSGEPAVATLRPLAFMASIARPGVSATVEQLASFYDPSDARSRVTEVTTAASGKADLTESEIIVSGGRGLRGPENFHLVEGLAEALGASVGASRAVVDAGWRPHSEQVGQTGKTVSPKLYVAIGISGAIQHLAGMSSAGCIVAINKDPEAPIFKIADYGIVGDAFEVVPALTEAVKQLQTS